MDPVPVGDPLICAAFANVPPPANKKDCHPTRMDCNHLLDDFCPPRKRGRGGIVVVNGSVVKIFVMVQSPDMRFLKEVMSP